MKSIRIAFINTSHCEISVDVDDDFDLENTTALEAMLCEGGLADSASLIDRHIGNITADPEDDE